MEVSCDLTMFAGWEINKWETKWDDIWERGHWDDEVCEKRASGEVETGEMRVLKTRFQFWNPFAWLRGSKWEVQKRHKKLEAADCNSEKNVWRRSRIRGGEVDLNHNRHGSDEMRGSTSCQRSITHGKRSERISIFVILSKLQIILPLLWNKKLVWSSLQEVECTKMTLPSGMWYRRK